MTFEQRFRQLVRLSAVHDVVPIFGITAVVGLCAVFALAFGVSQASGYRLLMQLRSGRPSACRVVGRSARAT